MSEHRPPDGDRSPPPGPGRTRQVDIYVRGVAGRRPAVPVAPDQLATRARQVMSPEAFAYVAGGAGAGSTMEANRRAFDRWRIAPRMLSGVEARDLSVELLGTRLPAPVLLAPIGVLELVHPEAGRAVARGAAAHGVPMIFSNQASVPMEACAAAMGDAPRWFQLYWSTSNELVESFVRRAEACGCEAIVLTLDTTLLGWRPRDLDLAYLPFLEGKGIAQYTSDPVFTASLEEPLPGPGAPDPPLAPGTIKTFLQQVGRYPGRWPGKLLSGKPRRAVQRFVATYSRPSLSWHDLAFLRELTDLPIVLKGILTPGDAERAVEHGMDGIVVSNHGGRQVDGAVASLDVLPEVVDAVRGRVPVLFDSGIRGGADAFKALALGATAVCLGRPYVYGLALAGERGVHEVIANLLAELDLTLGLAGCRDLGEVDRTRLLRAP